MRQEIVAPNATNVSPAQEDVLAYLEAENQHTIQSLNTTAELQETLYQEMTKRLAPDDDTVPVLRSEYYYRTQYKAGLEYPQYQRSKQYDGGFKTYLDVNELAVDYTYYQVGAIAVSPHNDRIAYSQDTIGRRNYTIHLKDINGSDVTDLPLGDTTGAIVWGAVDTLYYVKKDHTLRPHQIWRYNISLKKSELLYEEADALYRVFLTKTKDKKYILLGIASSLTTEYRYIDTQQRTGNFTTFVPRAYKEEYHISHHQDKWYIRTNKDGADNFTIMTCPQDATNRDAWQTYLPYDQNVYTTGIDVTAKYMVRSVRIAGQTEIIFTSWDNKEDRRLVLPEESYTIKASSNYETDALGYRLRYTSMTTPVSTLELKLDTWELVTLKEQVVVGTFDKVNYTSKRLYAQSSDGTQIPISLVYNKAYTDHHKQPLLLYAYGAYGYAIDPYFSSARLSLLDRGFVFAIAHVRGGNDFGHQWYEQGKFLHKKNTFEDFIACGRYLQQNEWCDPSQLFAMGGSAGGLLMGAIINMAPDMWRGVIAAVPFVDVLSTMLDDTIPLTVGEYEEWGNPNKEAYYHYIRSYSPYDNITEQDYPHMLVTSGYHDSQVQYWEPTKWVAKLRAYKTDDNLLLLHTNMEAGHGGASGRYRMYKETAMEYAFMLHLAGLSE
jgi:oligopeptidase B